MRAVVIACVACVACNAASAQLGLDDIMQVTGAQYRPGPFPEPTGGPATVSVVPKFETTLVGSNGEIVQGVLGSSATGAIIGVQGFDGTWIVTAGFPGIENPNNPTLTAPMALAERFPLGPFEVEVAATDLDGRIGSASTTQVIAAEAAPPTGTLVVSLVWDSTADLDLHVIDPEGNEAWSGSPNTVKPPPVGEENDPSRYYDGGLLDVDGDADCHQDGHPHEDVIWHAPPPKGGYTVRVDTKSLCSDPSAYWYVAAYAADGSVIAAARGASTPDDVAYDKHGAGGGVTALTFSQ